MGEPTVHTLDLNFQGFAGAIAAYLIPYPGGAVLVECGPGSTRAALEAGLAQHGYRPSDITHLLLTHIHLDHAGSAGWLARQGVQVYVHPNGAAHLINPEKLLASASRIYGDRMETLWGEFLPVPEEKLTVLPDESVVEAGQLRFTALDTPGHAIHHNSYILDDLCFSGDIGGVRLGGTRYLRLPMPPPDLNIEEWRASVKRLQQYHPRRIAPIHFGIYEDASWHLEEMLRHLDQAERWMEENIPSGRPVEELRSAYNEWMQQEAIRAGLPEPLTNVYEASNPSFMSVDGMMRYWKKYRMGR